MSSNQTLIVIAWDKELEGVLEATGAKEHWRHISGRQAIYYSDRIIVALTGASFSLLRLQPFGNAKPPNLSLLLRRGCPNLSLLLRCGCTPNLSLLLRCGLATATAHLAVYCCVASFSASPRPLSAL